MLDTCISAVVHKLLSCFLKGKGKEKLSSSAMYDNKCGGKLLE